MPIAAPDSGHARLVPCCWSKVSVHPVLSFDCRATSVYFVRCRHVSIGLVVLLIGGEHMERVTIASLATTLGISKASVSYALNGRPGVSEDTRGKVRALAEELGWRPSSTARALARAESGVIGVVLARSAETIGTEPYYMRLISGIESVLITTEMSLLIRVIGPEVGRDLEVYRQWAAERRVDGVILSDLHRNDGRMKLLDSINLPWVLHGEPGRDSPFVWIGFDNDADAFTAVDHFRGLGHRNIAYISGPQNLVHEKSRIDALARYAREAGMQLQLAEGDYTLKGGAQSTLELMSAAEPPTAILYGNDLESLGGLAALKESGISVPGDVSVLSWGDSMLCGLGTPPVSALKRTDSEEQGRMCAELLLRVIAGESPHSVMAAPAELIVRGSTGVAAERAPGTLIQGLL